jgi:glutamate synthase (NADPH/NADH) small chain
MPEKHTKPKIPRQEMPVQDRVQRRGNFGEVALGYSAELAVREAGRCLQCKHPKCIEGCPVGVLIPQFILALQEGDMAKAVRMMKTRNNLPAVCGRVCPQEDQCEGNCTLGKTGEPVAIGRLERYVGDYELHHRTCPMFREEDTGKKIAIAGSGPSGISCAVDLARLGHRVTIFESLHTPGGVLIYGIPEFRLPKELVRSEINYAVECLGIEIRTDHIVGRTIAVGELLEEYDAVFLGTGAGLPSFMPIPGINCSGVMSANEFLTRVNLMKAYRFPEYDTPVRIGKRVAVVGAGNVAMDSARSALRLQSMFGLQSGEVHIIYRRSSEEVPARKEEFHHAEEEGVIFDFLTNPVEILDDGKGNVRAIRCIRMELGEPDSSGRRKPVPAPNSEFSIEVDTVIMALGTSPNPLVFSKDGSLRRSKHGTVVADQDTGRTTEPRVWAGGDVVTGSATVISAMGAGKRAAADIHRFLMDENN